MAVTRYGLTGPMTAYGTFTAKEELVVFFPVYAGGTLVLTQLVSSTLRVTQVATDTVSVTRVGTFTVRVD